MNIKETLDSIKSFCIFLIELTEKKLIKILLCLLFGLSIWLAYKIDGKEVIFATLSGFVFILILLGCIYDYFSKKPLIFIKHTSFLKTECDQPIPEEYLKKFRLKFFEINQCNYTKNSSVINLEKSFKKLIKRIKCLQNKKNAQLALCARCHIPFMFYLGANLATANVKLLELSRNGNELIDLNVEPINYPKLQKVNYVKPNEKAINLLFSISLKINPDTITNDLSFCEFYLDNPEFDVIKSIKQIDEYTKQFFDFLNECQKAKIEEINLYYAGPMSLAFKLGQVVKLSMHPKVNVYNFSNNDEPKYGWFVQISNDFANPTKYIKDLRKAR